jgi:hypothetical protein
MQLRFRRLILAEFMRRFRLKWAASQAAWDCERSMIPSEPLSPGRLKEMVLAGLQTIPEPSFAVSCSIDPANRSRMLIEYEPAPLTVTLRIAETT